MNPGFNILILHAKLYVSHKQEARQKQERGTWGNLFSITYIFACLLFQVLLLPASPAIPPTPQIHTCPKIGFLLLIIPNGSYAPTPSSLPASRASSILFHKGFQSCTPPCWTLLPNP